MNCGEAHEYLFAFLDSELDAPLSLELQRHLDGCAGCAREAEIERTIRKRLVHAESLCEKGAPEFEPWLSTWLRTEGEVVHAVGVVYGKSTYHRRRIFATASAFVLLISCGVWFAAQFRTTQTASMTLAEALATDFEHFIEDGNQMQIKSNDPDSVTNWLRDNTTLAMALPDSRDPDCTLIGGRKCTINGKQAGFAVYEMHGALASLVTLKDTGADLQHMRKVRHDGVTHWVDHRRGLTILARRRGGLVYAAVSSLPEKQLYCLVSGELHESN